MADLVSSTFETLRATARQRGGSVPDLRRQGRSEVPRRARAVSLSDGVEGASIRVPGLKLDDAERKTWSGPGRPTGPDGRALPRGVPVKGFGSLVRTEIRKRAWTEKMAFGWVMGNWAGLVGEKIAQHTEVQMIKDGEVFISCDQTAWATELKYMQAAVLSAIADKIGPGVITKLHVYPPKTKSWRKGPLHVKGRGPRDTYG
ncbi:DciA family protein [Corynebacterium sanguinis]|uniref:DciA family protein n=1 Tax=Corynebacterium sanguinis TaxID=2594913 RepID=UPI00223B219D|nr:DciA family protein [Corynebacterium sanguinis]MCT1445213.1 DciA family protein [Corynebacterium sanguinis]MCT1556297.1 DciA family protein [Corynebacterium sanguinis]MCT1664932.1 DciA family protein [Corynebacterium sanguinis]MCT1883497.1 DciA family protein [Corynebacterium sanguinis]MCT2288864.1 DciA family protein [Corynebacterium sanguinis]